MVERYQLKADDDEERVGDYFATRKLQLIPSGCTLLDCVLGGGWPLGRFSNVVGDKAVGKTLVAIEACANFHRAFPKGSIWYRDAEAAFDEDYAEHLGLPVGEVDFGPDGLDSPWETVEEIHEDLEKQLAAAEKSGKPGLYILDSLDALTSESELERKMTDGSFGGEKPKKVSELFRRLKRRVKSTNVHVMILSQIRDKIGVTFGVHYSRTGGKALDFYASQIIYLSHLKTLTRTIKGVKRAYGVHIKAKATKNKIGNPFRDCEFDIRFGYGIDEVVASLEWLIEVKKLDRLGLKEAGVDAYITETDKLEGAALAERMAKIRAAVIQVWVEVDKSFEPKRRKYEAA